MSWKSMLQPPTQSGLRNVRMRYIGCCDSAFGEECASVAARSWILLVVEQRVDVIDKDD